MGLLWDEQKVYIASASAKLIHGESSPARDATLNAILTNSSIPGNLIAMITTGPATTVKRYASYGRNTFIDRLPTVILAMRHAMDAGPVEEFPLEIESYDPAYLGETKPLDVYPIINLKIDGEYTQDLGVETERYITSRRALRKISLNMSDLTDMIAENVDEDKINDAAFAFNLDLYSQIQESVGYMYEFWKVLYDKSPIDEAGFENSKLGAIPYGPKMNSLSITEGETQYHITYDYLTYEPDFLVFFDNEVDYSSFVDILPEENFPFGGANDDDNLYKIEKSVISFYKKHADNPTLAEKVTVHGLYVRVIGTAFGETQEIIHKLEDKFRYLEPDDPLVGTSGIYIPLSHDIVPRFTPFRRHILLNDAQMLTFVAADVVELEWYQQGIIKVVIVAVSFYVMGVGLGKAYAALASMTAKYFLASLVIAVGISYVIELIMTNVGGAIGVLLSFALIIAAMQIPGIGGASLSSMPIGSQAMWALKSGIKITAAAAKGMNKELKEDFAEMTAKYEQLYGELDEALEDYPQADSDLLTLVVNAVIMDPGESPDSYLARTTDVGVVLDISINQAENFYEQMLSLPDPNIRGT